MSDVILPDWIEDLPPFAREHVEDLEARIADLCKRLERARQRSRHLRKHRASARQAWASNARLRDELSALESKFKEWTVAAVAHQASKADAVPRADFDRLRAELAEAHAETERAIRKSEALQAQVTREETHGWRADQGASHEKGLL